MNEAVAYLQGNLSECAEVLMDIVRDMDALADIVKKPMPNRNIEDYE